MPRTAFPTHGTHKPEARTLQNNPCHCNCFVKPLPGCVINSRVQANVEQRQPHTLLWVFHWQKPLQNHTRLYTVHTGHALQQYCCEEDPNGSLSHSDLLEVQQYLVALALLVPFGQFSQPGQCSLWDACSGVCIHGHVLFCRWAPGSWHELLWRNCCHWWCCCSSSRSKPRNSSSLKPCRSCPHWLQPPC